LSSKIEFEYVKCNICDKGNSKHLFMVEDKQFESTEKFSIVKCRNCGLAYLNPRPEKNEIGKFYPKEYFSLNAFSDSKLRVKLWKFPKFFGVRSDFYTYSFIKKRSKGKILDVECGCGELLKLLKEDKWETYGVDTSITATEKAKKEGLDVFTGELNEAGFRDNYFDVVILHHSLEHIHDPTEVLRKIYRALKDNGTLIIGVPNIRSIRSRIFKKNWFAIKAPRHLYHFSVHTLDLLLDKTGFIRQKIYFDPSTKPLITNVVQQISNEFIKIFINHMRFIFFTILHPITLILPKFHLGDSFVVIAEKFKSIYKE